eukprot:UN08281
MTKGTPDSYSSYKDVYCISIVYFGLNLMVFCDFDPHVKKVN